MVGRRRSGKNEYYRNHFPPNKLLLILIIAVAPAVGCVPSTATEAAGAQRHHRHRQHDAVVDAADCARSVTCARCADRPACSWSLRRQTCAGTTKTSGGLRVHAAQDCPTLTAASLFVAVGDAAYVYEIKVGNAPDGLMAYLAAGGTACDVAGETSAGRVSGDRITCGPVAAARLRHGDDGAYVTVYRARVTLGDGVPLRTDNVSDGYFAASRRPGCGRGATWDPRSCVTCARDDAAGTDYLVRCSARNRCTGLFVYRDTRTLQSSEPAGALSCGPDVGVHSVEPARAPWTGGRTLRVTVRDRGGVLAEKARVTVTVAGRECVEPSVGTAADATVTVVTCAVPPADADGPAGAAEVRVTYALDSAPDSALELAAAGTPFRYAYPEIRSAERAQRYGPDNRTAGTEWTVTGALLNDSRGASVFVGAEDVACRVTHRSHDRIACADADAAAVARGGPLLMVEFDGPLRLYVVLAPWAVYAGEPALDAGQRFRAIASGGTALPVRGRRFMGASRPAFYAVDGDGVTRYGRCDVLDDTRAVCDAPRLDGAPSDFGLLVDFAGRVEFRLRAAPSSTYSASPDPVFADFQTHAASGTVTVNVKRRPRSDDDDDDDVCFSAGDVTVRLSSGQGEGSHGGGDGECVVTAVYRDRIVCAPVPSSASSLDRVRAVDVRVGDMPRQLVARKTFDRGPASFDRGLRWTAAIASSAVLVAVVAQLCRMKFAAKSRYAPADVDDDDDDNDNDNDTVADAVECTVPIRAPRRSDDRDESVQRVDP